MVGRSGSCAHEPVAVGVVPAIVELPLVVILSDASSASRRGLSTTMMSSSSAARASVLRPSALGGALLSFSSAERTVPLRMGLYLSTSMRRTVSSMRSSPVQFSCWRSRKGSLLRRAASRSSSSSRSASAKSCSLADRVRRSSAATGAAWSREEDEGRVTA